jgi:transcription elongation factor GreA
MPQPTLEDAVGQYAASLTPSSWAAAQLEVNRFVEDQPHGALAAQVRPSHIEEYAARKLGPSSPDVSKKASQVRAFLKFLYDEGFADVPLAPHLRLKKSGKSTVSSRSGGRKEPETVELTAEGIEALNSERESLIAQRPEIREAIRVAMLDKDFRENSPLDAAKDRQGHVEARIREIEATLRMAVEADGSAHSGRVRVGTTVTVTRLDDGQVKKYAIVGPTEANAADGKISSVSPVGKAFLNCRVGEEVAVEAPRGTQRFRIDDIT